MTFGFQLFDAVCLYSRVSEWTNACVYSMVRQQENTISKPKLWLSWWLSFHCIDLFLYNIHKIHGMLHARTTLLRYLSIHRLARVLPISVTLCHMLISPSQFLFLHHLLHNWYISTNSRWFSSTYSKYIQSKHC